MRHVCGSTAPRHRGPGLRGCTGDPGSAVHHTACQKILDEAGISNMHVEVFETSVVSLSGGTAALHRAFEPKYNAFHLTRRRDVVPEITPANKAMMPFLPLPAADGSRQPDQKTHALTSRHVAVRTRHNHDECYIEPSDTNGLIHIAWGATNRFLGELRNLEHCRSEMNRCMWPLQKLHYEDTASKADEEALALLESCENTYLGRVTDLIGNASELSLDAQERRVGQFAFAGKHGLNDDGGWSDWALVALDKAHEMERSDVKDSKDGGGDDSNDAENLFGSNQVSMDDLLSRKRGHLSVVLGLSDDIPIFHKMDTHGFVHFQLPAAAYSAQPPPSPSRKVRPNASQRGTTLQ
ncbi:hypothetical protein CMQ_4343 [Grosmannia clavigera kw1407]|uniref:Uncharacterized protein n=1 Tax=Grosmannia clavigera (strain kw1407 / UAMH 11150) TaxID=655863 RepID=F0XTX8_GROCL|nr:uncharacterized protein CMQ_4343 [Grosmannia clavigera kw1407]EFW98491.1 hypothetical protein CMQ_4343 [Grosmannia clavigera kw1407]